VDSKATGNSEVVFVDFVSQLFWEPAKEALVKRQFCRSEAVVPQFASFPRFLYKWQRDVGATATQLL